MIMRVWSVLKEDNADLTEKQINGWKNFLDLAMANGCERTTLAEDFGKNNCSFILAKSRIFRFSGQL